MRGLCLGFLFLGSLISTAQSKPADAAWRTAQIDDALRAAPAPVTADATIFGWNKTELVLLRAGTGPYTCVASGSWSLRLDRAPLPYPDPFCADQNAFAYIRAVWSEPDPLHPVRPFPRAPGLVWMLAGMNLIDGTVAYSADGRASLGVAGKDHRNMTMTPHLMILPLPLDPKAAGLPAGYDPDHDLVMWIMGANTPTAHLHVHFTPATHKALQQLK
ncbi:MAG TPA: hypothetical protein VMZ25_03960 [Terriglobales bacterium]|nr:hypothetical protein [Terriglobales bacterium]